MADKLPPVKELRTLPSAELQHQIEKLRSELWQQRLKARDGALQQTHQLNAMRRQIARIQTVLSEQKRSAAVGATRG